MIKIETYSNIKVLRDDLLPGGTKSVAMPFLMTGAKEYVYATPVYGGFQIALSEYCKANNLKATIFCAKRNVLHDNTLQCIDLGANVINVPYGYMSVLEHHARKYCTKTGAQKISFGAKHDGARRAIADRARRVMQSVGGEPDEIWCAIGSGLLVECILSATQSACVFGVQVGAEYKQKHDRLTVVKYHRAFDKKSKITPVFKSMPNYDLKAWEYCLNMHKSKNVLFWNVL